MDEDDLKVYETYWCQATLAGLHAERHRLEKVKRNWKKFSFGGPQVEEATLRQRVIFRLVRLKRKGKK